MKRARPVHALPLAAMLLAGAPLHAQTDAAHDAGTHRGHAAPQPPAAEAAAAAQEALSDGEVVRWDAATGRLTLRHGELKNLAMPPMTMVFRLRRPAPDALLAPGTRVRFQAEQERGSLVVTHIEQAG